MPDTHTNQYLAEMKTCLKGFIEITKVSYEEALAVGNIILPVGQVNFQSLVGLNQGQILSRLIFLYNYHTIQFVEAKVILIDSLLF